MHEMDDRDDRSKEELKGSFSNGGSPACRAETQIPSLAPEGQAQAVVAQSAEYD